MKKKLLILLMLFITLTISACANDLELTKDAIALYETEITNPDNEEDGYIGLQYENRFYVPYGGINKFMNNSELKENIGYVFNEEFPEDKDMLCYSLVSTDDFIVAIYKIRLMNEPLFYRALDTKDKDIDIPNYINSLDYEIWK